MAHIIVVGNEKGGSGKTTTSMHIIAALLYLGFRVSSIDIDVRQASLTRYIDNRRKSITNINPDIPVSTHHKLKESTRPVLSDKILEEQNQLIDLIAETSKDSDFVVIDTPGANNTLSEIAHSYADVVITPINDSFMDIDLLAQVKNNYEIIQPGIYSQMIWQQKMNRAKRDRKSIDWLIMRNRISGTDNINKRNTEKVIQQLSKRMGCRIAPGFGERVIFKELFLNGLTLLDIKQKGINIPFTISHIAARQELIGLLQALNLQNIDSALEKTLL